MAAEEKEVIALVGDTGTGKTKLVYMLHGRPQEPGRTIGAEFTTFKFGVPDQNITYECWDIAGNTGLNSLLPMYLKKGNAILFVFDVTKPESLKALESFIKTAKETNPDATKFLVANKIDLEDWKVSKEDVKAFAAQHDMILVETAATDQHSVNNLFRVVGQTLAAKRHPISEPVEERPPEIEKAKEQEPHTLLEEKLGQLIGNDLTVANLKAFDSAFENTIYNKAQGHTGIKNYLGSKDWKNTWDYARTVLLTKIYDQDSKGDALALINAAKEMAFFKQHVNTSSARSRGKTSSVERLEKWAKETVKGNKISSKFVAKKHTRKANVNKVESFQHELK